MVCLDCGNRDVRYDEKEKSYHCNNCGSRELGIILLIVLAISSLTNLRIKLDLPLKEIIIGVM